MRSSPDTNTDINTMKQLAFTLRENVDRAGPEIVSLLNEMVKLPAGTPQSSTGNFVGDLWNQPRFKFLQKKTGKDPAELPARTGLSGISSVGVPTAENIYACGDLEQLEQMIRDLNSFATIARFLTDGKDFEPSKRNEKERWDSHQHDISVTVTGAGDVKETVRKIEDIIMRMGSGVCTNAKETGALKGEHIGSPLIEGMEDVQKAAILTRLNIMCQTTEGVHLEQNDNGSFTIVVDKEKGNM